MDSLEEKYLSLEIKNDLFNKKLFELFHLENEIINEEFQLNKEDTIEKYNFIKGQKHCISTVLGILQK